MYNPTLRLLTILELLQSYGQLSAADLAQRLEVEERSVRRYIMMLRDMGIPIESERGRYGGYMLRPGFRLPPLMFNQDEIVAVMLGLLTVQEMGALSALAVDTATAKIERVLPVELKHTAHALRQTLDVDRFVLPAQHISSQWLWMLSLAAFEKCCLVMNYTSASGDLSQRTISPYGVVLHGKTGYIPAYCHWRQDLRIFRLDRVQELTKSGADYHPAAIDPQDYVLKALAQMPGMHEFEIMLHAPLETARFYVPSGMAILEARDDTTLLHCHTDDPFWLARFLMQLEIPFTIRESDALRDALKILTERILTMLD